MRFYPEIEPGGLYGRKLLSILAASLLLWALLLKGLSALIW